MAEVEERLVVRMEATLARFEKQMAKARQAANTNATGIEDRFDRMGSRMGQSSEKAARGLSSVINVSSRGRFVIQNTAAQLGDMAVQLESGTAASRVMAQQLPQVLGGFGALGGALGIVAPLLGTVAAIGIPVAAALYAVGQDGEEAGKKVKTFADKLSEAEGALGRAEQAMARAADGGVEDLLERYGEVTEAVRELALELANIEKRAAQVSVGNVIDSALGEGFKQQIGELFGGVGEAIVDNTEEGVELARQRVRELASEITNLNGAGQPIPPGMLESFTRAEEELAALEGRFEDMGSVADDIRLSPELIRQIAEAETALRAAASAADFRAVADGFAEILDLLRQTGEELDQGVVDGLIQAEDKARLAAKSLGDAEVAASGTADAASAIGPALGSGVSAAAALAMNLGISLDAARRLAALGPQGVGNLDTNGRRYSGRGGDPRDMGGSALDVSTAEAGAFLDNYREPKAAGRGRGGRGSSGAKAKDFDSGQQEIEALQRRIEMLGKTESEIAKLTSRYRLLDEAKRKGLDLDARQAATGETLREQIDRQAESIGKLTETYNRAQERADFFEQAQQDLKDGFIDAILEGENLSGVLENLAKSLARAALQAALFGDGPFGGGGGGLLGGLFSLFRPRASGGPVTAGQPYMVGEKGPEPFFPAVNGRVLSTAQAQAAMSGGAGGGTLEIILGEGLQANWLRQAAGQSVQITTRAMGVQQTTLKGRVQAMEERGTTG